MFKILTPLSLVQRADVRVHDNVLASGYAGSWITINAASSADRPGTFPTATSQFGYIIFSEGNKRGSTVGSSGLAGFTPDTAQTKKVTTLVGKWRGITDQVTTNGGTVNVGDYLCFDPASAGKLMKVAAPNTSGIQQVAMVRDKITSLVHLGVTYGNVYELEALI